MRRGSLRKGSLTSKLKEAVTAAIRTGQWSVEYMWADELAEEAARLKAELAALKEQ